MKATIGAAIAIIAIAVGAPAVGGAAGAVPACSATAGVTVIVDFTHFPGGKIERGCAPGYPADALTALHAAGFATAGTAQYGDAFLCRIDGLPTPAQDACAVTPPSTAYWAYWHARPSDAKWTYGTVSVLEYRPAVGSIEAFAFGSHAQPGISPAAALPPPPSTTTPPSAPPTVAPTTAAPTTAAPPVSTATLQPAPTVATNAPDTLAPTRSTVPASTRGSSRATLPATSTTIARVVERAASGPAPHESSGSPLAVILTIAVVGCLAIGAFAFTRARRHRPA